MYRLLEGYYEKGSELLEADVNRGRTLCDRRRRAALNAVKKKFAPFLRKCGAREIGDIDIAMLSRLQDHLLKTLSAKTVNDVISSARMMFKCLAAAGHAKTNPFAGLPSVKKGGGKITGCYVIGRVKGAFNREWKDLAHQLLCLLIYSTNMRNGEINKRPQKDGGIRRGSRSAVSAKGEGVRRAVLRRKRIDGEDNGMRPRRRAKGAPKQRGVAGQNKREGAPSDDWQQACGFLTS